MNYLLLVTLTIVSFFISSSRQATDKIVCYVATWANYRPDNGKFLIEDIDATKCTHVMYAFAGINEDGTLRILDSYLDIDLKGYKRAVALKQQNSNLKVLISVGGWNEGSVKFSRVAADATKRNNLLKSAMFFINNYGFDGIDIDWEYPAQRGGAPEDKANLIKLLSVLKNGFKSEHLLTIAVSGFTREESYDIKAISDNVDFMNLMVYDFHMATDGKTGQNAPLYGSSITNDFTNCVDACVKSWIEKGADPQKIIMGIGFYGHTFQLRDPNNHALGAPSTGPGQAGPISRQAGMLGYMEICGDGWTEVWDDEQQVPYRYSENQWVGFDNQRSIVAKVKYAKSKKLGGLMVWSVDTDDFHGFCGSAKPLLTEIKNNLLTNTKSIEKYLYIIE